MSTTTGRIKRGRGPKAKLSEWNYRKRAWPFLVEDFQSRCGYSMRHLLQCGERCMEVDHFDPTRKSKYRHLYGNLMLATRLCNNFKQHTWPSAQQQKSGMRFLDPTRELDYGVQIFEDPVTHKLVGVTPAARYHIRSLGLNDPSFVAERMDRTALAAILEKPIARIQATFEETIEAVQVLRERLRVMIPPIPPPPQESGNAS